MAKYVMKSLFLLHEYLAFISFEIIALPVPAAVFRMK